MGVLQVKLRRDLRRSRTQVLGIVVTVFLGVMLFGATYDAYQSLGASYDAMFQRVGFADLWVTAAPEGLEGALAADPAVAVAEVRHTIDVPFRIGDRRLLGRVVGVPSGATVNRVMLLEGDMFDPTAADQVVADQHLVGAFGLEVGDTIDVATPAGWQSVTITGVGASAEYLWPARSRQEILALPDQFGVLYAPDRAVAAAGPAAVREVVARLDPTVDPEVELPRLEALVRDRGGGDVSTRAQQPSNAALQEDVQAFGEMSFMFPVLFLGAAGLGMWVLLTRLVVAQRAIIGTLRAEGMSRRRVFGHYLAFGVGTGIVGAVPGAAAGAGLALLIARAYTGAIDVPITVVRVTPSTPVIGIAFGLVGGALAAWAPARRAMSLQPAEAMRGPAPTGRGRMTLLERLWPRGLSAGTRLVIRNAVRNPRRTVATALGVTSGLTLILVSWGMLDTVQVLLERQFRQIVQADAQVAFLDPGMDVGRLGDVEGVAAVEPVVQAPVSLAVGDETYGTVLWGFERETVMHRFLGPSDEELGLGGGMLVGVDLRDLLGVAEGEMVTVRFGSTGEVVAVPIAGFVDEPLGTRAYLDLATLRAEAPRAASVGRQAMVRYEPGADPEAVRRALESVPGVAAVIPTRALEAAADEYMGLFYAFVGVMLALGAGLALVLVFNTMTVNLAERTVEVATMRAEGVSARRLAKLITAENLVVMAAATVPGLVVADLVAVAFMASFDSDLFTFTLHIRPLTFVWTALSILVAGVISQRPGLRTLRSLDVARVVRERSV